MIYLWTRNEKHKTLRGTKMAEYIVESGIAHVAGCGDCGSNGCPRKERMFEENGLLANT